MSRESKKALGLLGAIAVLGILAASFAWQTALRPNSLSRDGRFVLDTGLSLDSAITRLYEENRIHNIRGTGIYVSSDCSPVLSNNHGVA